MRHRSQAQARPKRVRERDDVLDAELCSYQAIKDRGAECEQWGRLPCGAPEANPCKQADLAESLTHARWA